MFLICTLMYFIIVVNSDGKTMATGVAQDVYC